MFPRFRLIPLFVSACFLIPSSGSANPLIELDVDGIPGNGPDTIQVGLGETFEVGAWIHPDNNGLLAAAIRLEDAEGAFHFQDIQFYPPEGWESVLYHVDSVTVVFGVEWRPPYSCLYSPWKIAVLTFQSMTDQDCGTLIVQDWGSGCALCDIWDCEWAVPSVEPTVCTGIPTGTEGTTWGRVKKLFR
ncbi:MAG: hypothetical protein ABIK65_13515 [Candidatus Eisenbacteria bacterium]